MKVNHELTLIPQLGLKFHSDGFCVTTRVTSCLHYEDWRMSLSDKSDVSIDPILVIVTEKSITGVFTILIYKFVHST